MSDTPPLAPSAPVIAPGPPSDPLSAADAQARIDAIFADKTHAYHRGDKAATEAVHQLFRVRDLGPGALDQTELRPDLPAAIPPEFADVVPPMVAEDLALTLQAVGLSPLTPEILAFAVARAGPPTLPPAYRPPSLEVAAAKLEESEGRHFEYELDRARRGAYAVDALRAQAGRPAGEFVDFLEAYQVFNDPPWVRFFERLGGRFEQTHPDLMKALARRRG